MRFRRLAMFRSLIRAVSILAEPSFALVDKAAKRKGPRKVAESYLRYLYSTEVQDTIVKHCCRPNLSEVGAKYDRKLFKFNLSAIEELFGGWQKALSELFSDGGISGQIYT